MNEGAIAGLRSGGRRQALATCLERFGRVIATAAVRLGTSSVVAAAFVIPISVTGTAVLTAVAAGCWVVSGKVRELPQQAKANAVVLASLLPLGLLAVGLTYSTADARQALGGFWKYRELFLVAVFMSFLGTERCRRLAIGAFAIAMLLTLAVSYAKFFGWLQIGPPGRYAGALTDRITHSVLMAFFAFWAAHRISGSAGWRRWGWIVVVGLAFFNVLFVVGGRTGQVIIVALAALFFYQRFRWRGLAAAAVVLGVLAGAFLLRPDLFSGRLSRMFRSLHVYRNRDVESSVGIRIEFWKNTLTLIGKRPILGSGTGSFTKEYDALASENGLTPCRNPHNEYLMIGVQAGLVGVFLYVWWLFAQWWHSRRLARDYAHLAQGLVLAMAVGSMANSFLFDHAEGHFFTYFAAVFFAPLTESARRGQPPLEQRTGGS